ncbi:MAG: leucyl aminopeptidase [Candidatus Rifleibacteriota bacterium]
MIIDLTAGRISEIKTRALVLPVFEDAGEKKFSNLGSENEQVLSRLVESGEIAGKYKEFTLLHCENRSAERILVMGLGKRIHFTLERLMAVAAVAARNLRRIKVTEITFINDFNHLGISASEGCRAIAEGISLGLYKFRKYTRENQPDYHAIARLNIALTSGEVTEDLVKSAQKGEILGEATNMVRDLVNFPANKLTPEVFSDHARRVADETGLKIKVLDREEIARENMNALLAVNQGSANPPRVVVLEYDGGRPEGQVLGLVGKGITFDSGGLSLKPTDSMFRMHCDMAGAAAVLGAMQCIAKNRLPVNVVAVMPLTENLVDANSYKVGDVISTREGLTVEILNTDAEGRLILADALSYIRSYRQLDYLVDIATLTGAIVTALGHFCSGAMTNNQEFFTIVQRASERSTEKIWQLPLLDDYMAQIQSDIADLENTGGPPGSSITAAMFLKQFVGKVPWVHLDIAGTAWMDESTMTYMKNPFLPKEGATGFGTRLLYYLAEMLAE